MPKWLGTVSLKLTEVDRNAQGQPIALQVVTFETSADEPGELPVNTLTSLLDKLKGYMFRMSVPEPPSPGEES